MLDLHFARIIATRALKSSTGIVKRGIDDTKDDLRLGSPLIISMILFNIFVLVPFFIYLLYTLGNIFITLAIVEKEPRFEQEALLTKDDFDHDAAKDDFHHDAAKADPKSIEESFTPNSKPVTASIRSIHQLLWSIRGFPSLFRYLLFYVAMSLVEVLLAAALNYFTFLPMTGSVVVACLLTLPLQATWVHLVISQPSKKSGITRLPGIKKTYIATAVPSALFYLVNHMSGYIMEPFTSPNNDYYLRTNIGQLFIYSVVQLVIAVLFRIPIGAVLVRIQASLLPDIEQTIVASDRSFGIDGARERGYLSICEAFQSFNGDWRRIYKLQAKTLLLNMAGQFLLAGILVGEYILCVLHFKL